MSDDDLLMALKKELLGLAVNEYGDNKLYEVNGVKFLMERIYYDCDIDIYIVFKDLTRFQILSKSLSGEYTEYDFDLVLQKFISLIKKEKPLSVFSCIKSLILRSL